MHGLLEDSHSAAVLSSTADCCRTQTHVISQVVTIHKSNTAYAAGLRRRAFIAMKTGHNDIMSSLKAFSKTLAKNIPGSG